MKIKIYLSNGDTMVLVLDSSQVDILFVKDSTQLVKIITPSRMLIINRSHIIYIQEEA
jgi:hypothetical protein